VSAGLFFRMMRRESRGARGRLVFFAACMAVGVAAVVGVAALVAAVDAGIRTRSRELLGGDLALESRRPLPELAPLLPAPLRDAPRVQLSILSTMVRTPSGASRLAEVKAVESATGAYPLAGTLTLDPPRPLAALLADDAVVVAPELLRDLKLAAGDTLELGGVSFRVAGRVLQEPDAVSFSVALGPRVLMTRAALARTHLLGFGNRVRHRALIALPGEASTDALTRLRDTLRDRVPGGRAYVSIETHAEAQPALRRTLERVEAYLGLVALLSLLVASVGVAQIVSTWLAQAAPQIAVLRCLGMRPREVAALYLGHVLVLALVGSLLGAALGATLPTLLAHLRPDLLPIALDTTLPRAAVARGLALGLGVPALFSLPPLTGVRRISPLRVLRSETHAAPVPRAIRVLAVALAALSIALAARLQSGDLRTAAAFSLGTCALAGLLWLGARGLARMASRLPRRRLPVLLWQGAAALARPGAGTTGSIVALGLGTLVVLAVTLLRGMLDEEIDTALPEGAPSVFLLDVQPDQWDAVATLARSLGATRAEGVPVAMARLVSVDGRTVEQLLETVPGDRNERGRAHWVLSREQRISWMRALPPDNRIVEGALWSDPGVAEMSVEQGFARDLGARLGSVLRFDVQGVPLDFTVTSLRTLRWRSFSTNFFMVAEPGVLDDAPHFVLGALRLPTEREQALQDALAARHPNVTTLRVEGLLARLDEVLAQAALAVRVLGSFTALAGLIILAGAIASAQLRRARETALLKALGLTRLQVVALFAVEYALAGAVAGLLGAAGAYALAFTFAREVLELATRPPLTICLVGVALTSALSVVAGLIASARALRVGPLAVLRRRS